jgi:hypothetical protein
VLLLAEIGILIEQPGRDERTEAVNDRFAALLAMTSMLLLACEAPPGPPPPAQTGDYNRMQRVHFPDIDSVYRKQVDLSVYTKVMIASPTVAFRENWRPADDPALVRVNLPDPAAVSEYVSQQFLQTLTTRLAENGGYAVVAAPAADVLQVKAAISDLYFSSSALQSAAGDGEPYYMESSEITVAIELRDSSTGELLCLVTDHRASPNVRTVELNQGLWSSPGLRNASEHWASSLRRFLDQAKRENRQ